MRKLFYILAVVSLLPLWSCGDDEDGGLSEDTRLNLLYQARVNDDFLQFSYDAQGRVTGRFLNGQPAGTVTYAANGSSLTLVYGDGNDVIPLNALGYAEEFSGDIYEYYTTGAQAGYIQSITTLMERSVSFVTEDKDAPEGVTVSFVVDAQGRYTTFTIDRPEMPVLTGTITYAGNLVNRSESFNPITQEWGITFLGKAPAYLPTRMDVSDGSYMTYSYTLFPSGHVKKMIKRSYDDEGNLESEDEFSAHWRSGGSLIMNGFTLPGTVGQRITSVTEWAGTEYEESVEITYDAQNRYATLLMAEYGEDPQNLVITYPTATTIAVNGIQVGTLNASGNILTMFNETYTYNASGFLTLFTAEEDGETFQEAYTYDEEHCITSVLWKADHESDDVWDEEELWEYTYETEEGVRIPNMSDCVDVARYNFWNAHQGKVSYFLPVTESGPGYLFELDYDLDENWYPVHISWTGILTDDEGEVDLEWEEWP